MKQVCCFLFALVVFAGCVTDPIDKPLPGLVFQKEEVYTLDTSKLVEADPPNFIFLIQDSNGNFRTTKGTETPTFVALAQPDLVKIDAMLTIKNAYKDVSKEQGHLINIERDKMNALKEMLALERQNRQAERELRLDAEKIYRKERWDHQLDNIINRGTLVLAIVGGVALVAL